MSPKIITAMDPNDSTQARSLAIYSLTMTDEKLATETTVLVDDEDIEEQELDVDVAVVRSLLYGTENLRKQRMEQGDEQGGEPEGDDEMEVDATKD